MQSSKQLDFANRSEKKKKKDNAGHKTLKFYALKDATLFFAWQRSSV